MSKIQTAAIYLAVKTLTQKHGWVNTEATAKFITPFGVVVTIGVKDDTATASVYGVGDVLTVKLADPEFDTKISKIEAAITQNAEYAYEYARDMLMGPFPAGEAAIAQSAEYAYKYAYNVLKGPFPAGEAAIAQSAKYAYCYARDVLMGPFPAGEAAIAANAQYAYWYAHEVLDGPFPAGEAAIAKDAEFADRYAKYALKLPEVEVKNWRKRYLAKTKRKSAKKGKV